MMGEVAMLAVQVFRALQSGKEAEACSSLLACLHKCLQTSAQKSLCHDSVEICLTLQVWVPSPSKSCTAVNSDV